MRGFTHILDEAFETVVKDTPNLCASRFEPPWLLHSVAATSVWKGVKYSRPVARAALFLSITLSLFAATVLGQENGTVIVTVRSESGEPAPQVEVQAGEQVALTDDRGEATLQLPPGHAQLSLQRYGFVSKTVRANITAGQTSRIGVELEAQAVVKEEIFV